jgi:GT2 family glycosyltransferase
MARVDVVVVSYNNRETLRGCVEGLAHDRELNVIVVDNASPDDSLASIADLELTRLPQPANGGFAQACNAGAKLGTAPFVLFLNPDATITPAAIRTLASVLEAPGIGAAGPLINAADGTLELSQRRFPRLRSTFAHALFLNQLFPRATWSSELVTDPHAYERAASPEWISGACLMTRRDLLERLGGWDERFFLYCEDKDLCRRIRDLGFDIRFEPTARAQHVGGASAPRPALMPVLTASRIRYAQKHFGGATSILERLGVALVSLGHAVVTRGGRAARSGHAASALVALGVRRPTVPKPHQV